MCGIWGVYMYLGYTPDVIVLVSRYCVTCLDLLFSNRQVSKYIYLYLEAKVVGHAHWCAGLTADQDVRHVGGYPISKTLGTVWPPTRIQDMSIQFVRGRGGHGKDRPAVRDQGSVVRRHRKLAIQCKSHANLSQLLFAVVQRGCNICGARRHNANPLKIATGLDLLQTPRSEPWSRKCKQVLQRGPSCLFKQLRINWCCCV